MPSAASARAEAPNDATSASVSRRSATEAARTSAMVRKRGGISGSSSRSTRRAAATNAAVSPSAWTTKLTRAAVRGLWRWLAYSVALGGTLSPASRTSPTTPTIVNTRLSPSMLPNWMRRPIAPPFAKKGCFAKLWLTTATWGASGPSWASNSRPAASGMPSAAK